MAYRIMTVCTGNICRSPMAEVVLRELLEAEGLDVEIDSTGVSDEEHGRPMDRRAVATLAEAGYPTPRHRARRVRRDEPAERDLVLAMTAQHAAVLRRLDPEHADKVRLLRSFDPAAPVDGPEHRLDVEDPWYGTREDFQVTLAQIEAAAPGIVAHVRAATRAAAQA